MASKRRALFPLEAALVVLKSTQEAAALMEVLMTPREIKSIRNRWEAFQLTAAGATQRAIRDRLHVSISTASRSARVIKQSPSIVETIVARIK